MGRRRPEASSALRALAALTRGLHEGFVGVWRPAAMGVLTFGPQTRRCSGPVDALGQSGSDHREARSEPGRTSGLILGSFEGGAGAGTAESWGPLAAILGGRQQVPGWCTSCLAPSFSAADFGSRPARQCEFVATSGDVVGGDDFGRSARGLAVRRLPSVSAVHGAELGGVSDPVNLDRRAARHRSERSALPNLEQLAHRAT